jgi:hypothetical protein
MIGDAALGIWLDVDTAGLDDFNAWYRRQHLPERLSVPGFLRGRRYQTTGDGPVYFTLYETVDAAVLSSAPYLERLDDPTDWTRRALPRVRRMVRNAYRRVAGSPTDRVAPHLLTVRIKPHSGRGPAVKRWLVEEAVGAFAGVDGVAGVALYESDGGGTSVVTEERRIVGGEVVAAPPFLALCELAQAHIEPAVRDFWQTKTGREAADVELDGYRLMYGLAWIGP